MCDIDKFVRGAEAGGLASRNKLHIYAGKTKELVVEIVRKSLLFLQRQFIASLWGVPPYEEGTREALYEISVIPVTFERDWRQVHRLTGS